MALYAWRVALCFVAASAAAAPMQPDQTLAQGTNGLNRSQKPTKKSGAIASILLRTRDASPLPTRWFV